MAGIWSQNIDTAHYVASRVQAGQVFVNNYGSLEAFKCHLEAIKKRIGGGFVAKLYANEKYRYTLCTT